MITAGEERDGVMVRRRLVLGFDAGCVTCSDLARHIREQVGGEIEVLSLLDPQVQNWRERALGEDAPWAPTLFEVCEGDVKAWTGWRMGARMARVLGTTVTWQVMQILGEKDVVPVLGTEGVAGRLAGHFSRARFLKGVGGALIAASVLSGTNALTPKASAQGWTHPLERLKFKTKVHLTGAARRETLSSAAESQDVKNLWDGQELPTKGAFAVRHTLEDDTVLTATSWVLPEERILVYYSANRPIGNYRSEAMILGFVPGKEVWNEAESVNGRQRSVVSPSAGAAANRSTVQASGCGCCRWRWACVATVASACVGCGNTCATCVATPAKWACGACLSCALVGCPIGIRQCCADPCG